MSLLSTFRKAARRVVHVDVQRASALTMPFERLVTTLEQHHVSTVIDVGANDGGFGSELFDAGYRGRVISFEPLPDIWLALKHRAKTYGSRWIVGPRVALSDKAGQATFYVAGKSESSSLLPMMPSHE